MIGIPKQVKGGGTERNIREYKDEVPISGLRGISNLISNVQRNRPDFEKITRILDNVNYKIAQKNIAEVEEDIANTVAEFSVDDKRKYLEWEDQLTKDPDLSRQSPEQLDGAYNEFWAGRDKAHTEAFKKKSGGNKKLEERYKARYLSRSIENKLWTHSQFSKFKTNWGTSRNIQAFANQKDNNRILLSNLNPTLDGYWNIVEHLTKDWENTTAKAFNDGVINKEQHKKELELFELDAWLKAITFGGTEEDGEGYKEWREGGALNGDLLSIRSDGEPDFTFLLNKLQQKTRGRFVHKQFFGKELDSDMRANLVDYLRGESISQQKDDRIEFDNHNLKVNQQFNHAVDAIINGEGEEFTLDWFDNNINFEGQDAITRKKALRELFIKVMKKEYTTDSDLKIEMFVRNLILKDKLRADTQKFEVIYVDKNNKEVKITTSINDLEARNLISTSLANSIRQKISGSNSGKIKTYSGEFNAIKRNGNWGDLVWGYFARYPDKKRGARFPGYSRVVTRMMFKAENYYIAGKLQGYTKQQLVDETTKETFKVDMPDYGIKKGDSIYIWRDLSIATRDVIQNIELRHNNELKELVKGYEPPPIGELSYDEYIKTKEYKKWRDDPEKQDAWKNYLRTRKLLESLDLND
tara:strand:- start:3153 stop:5069 length:1917 start_codon:yes stop_codon:yes gene_type:complete